MTKCADGITNFVIWLAANFPILVAKRSHKFMAVFIY